MTRRLSTTYSGITASVLSLGSMGLGLGATAVVLSDVHGSSAATIMVLTWLAIAGVNVTFSNRH
jgi:hypothetical protein